MNPLHCADRKTRRALEEYSLVPYVDVLVSDLQPFELLLMETVVSIISRLSRSEELDLIFGPDALDSCVTQGDYTYCLRVERDDNFVHVTSGLLDYSEENERCRTKKWFLRSYATSNPMPLNSRIAEALDDELKARRLLKHKDHQGS